MIELYPFTSNDFELFKSWITTEEDLFQFAGAIFTYPLTNQQLTNYLSLTDKKPFKVVLSSTNRTIGHCELNFENGHNRLSRILVGDTSLRGQGMGELIVRKMANLLFQDPEVNEVDLNVFDWNKAAIKCYEKVGFKIKPNQTATYKIKGNTWTTLNMVLTRKQQEIRTKR